MHRNATHKKIIFCTISIKCFFFQSMNFEHFMGLGGGLGLGPVNPKYSV